jgi:hypothetical protein
MVQYASQKTLIFATSFDGRENRALFLAEFVAQSISKRTIHKRLLFLDLQHAHWLRSRLDL